MKELYLTVTDMTFLLDGEVLGSGRTIAAAPGPETPGELSRGLEEGAVRMGTFFPAGTQILRGRWEARLEVMEGFALTFRDDRFLLSGTGRQQKTAAAAR